MKIENPILMAQIGGAHGIKGEVRVRSFGDDPLALGDYGSLYDKEGRKFKIMRLRISKNVLVVKFKGTNYRDEAQALNGIELFIDRSMLPDDTEEDEFYVSDMIGCTAFNENNEEVGIVLTVVNFGAGDLVEIQPTAESKTIMLEFTRENVPEVNLAAKRLTVRLPNEVSERDV